LASAGNLIPHGGPALKRILIFGVFTIILLVVAVWLVGTPYLHKQIEINLGKNDMRQLVFSINKFRSEFQRYPKNLNELVSKELLMPFDLQSMTSQAQIIYFPPTSPTLDSERVLIQGDVRGKRFVARESLEVIESEMPRE